MIPDINITIIQADLIWQDKQRNLAKFETFFKKLKSNTDIVVLPEMFNTGFVVEPTLVAEDNNGVTIKWMALWAKELDSVIVGSIVVVENNNYFNRLIWMLPDGNYHKYDKRHLFQFGREHEHFTQGDEKLIVEYLGWKICPMICYDLRFPVWSKNTYTDGVYAYDIALYIANWPAVRSNAFRRLLVARAIENQSYVIGVNRVGIDNNGMNHQGGSSVMNFKGDYMVEVEPDMEGMESVTISYNQLDKYRSNFTVGMDWDDFKILI